MRVLDTSSWLTCICRLVTGAAGRRGNVFRLLMASCLWVVLPSALGQIQPAWTRAYDTPRHDFAQGLAVDAQGNICVLVDSSGAFTTLKYSPDGSLLWTDTYDTSREDVPGSLGVDASGNIWVTGTSRTNDLPGNLVTIKYAPNGSRLWVRTAEETNAARSYPLLTFDAAGQGYVTGTSATDGASFVAIKYDSNGGAVWVRHYAAPGGSRVGLNHATFEPAGNLIVVGNMRIGADPTRLVFLKYDQAGNLLSAATNVWATTNEFITGVSSDPDGNVYVAGAVEAPDPWMLRYHFLTAKYTSSGELVWSVLRPPAQGYHAISGPVKADSAGNVIVSGYEYRPVDEDDDEYQAVTIKYAPDGNQLWTARSTFQRIPRALAMDVDGNIYVVGDTRPFIAPIGAFLLKYAPNGSQLWYKELSSIPFQKFALAPSGELYLNDIVDLGGNWSVETRKFTQTPVPGQPTATIVPALTEVFPGSNVTLTAVVSGPGPFTYQWLHFGYLLTGETNATFTVNNVQFEWWHQGDFCVVVSNASGSTISPEARITVLRPPIVDIQLTNQFLSAYKFVSVGEPATFAARALGTEPFSFQWYFNGSPISGGASNLFSIPQTHYSDAGNYHVVVTNRAGAATSAVVRLVFVLPPVSPANATPIQINSNNVTPYPSEIVVQGVTGNVLKVRVTLCGLTDDSPVDLSVFLQGPLGQNVLLMSDSGEDSGAYNLTITFDDEAWAMLPDDIYSGTYSPRDPLSVFNGLDPNGTWRLFVDNASWVPAEIACGWQLTLLVADPAANFRPSINSIVCAGDHISLQWDGVPGRRLQRSSSLTSPDWTDVPDSEGKSFMQLPIASGNQFFRLTGP